MFIPTNMANNSAKQQLEVQGLHVFGIVCLSPYLLLSDDVVH
jgi:hypothetical protein